MKVQSNKSLFSISLEYQAILDLIENDLEINEETGEITDNSQLLNDLFNELKLSFEDKLDNSQRYILTLKGEQDILDKEIKRLQAKKTALKNKEDSLKRLMLNALSESGETSFKTSLYSFIIKESEAISIVNEEELERKYMRISYEPDKVKIKEAITLPKENYLYTDKKTNGQVLLKSIDENDFTFMILESGEILNLPKDKFLKAYKLSVGGTVKGAELIKNKSLMIK